MKKLICNCCKESLGSYGVDAEYFSLMDIGSELRNTKGLICHKCIIRDSNVDKLYHTSVAIDKVEEFYPRIPELRAPGEDNRIDRICLSSSIEGCLTGAPYPGYRLDGHFFWQDDSSFLIRVYEFDIGDLDLNKIIPTEYLYYSNLVGDAYLSDEYWYTGKIKPSRTYIIELKDVKKGKKYDLDYKDLVNLKEEKKYEGKFCDYIKEIKFEIVPEEKRSGILALDYKVINTEIEKELDISYVFNSIHPSPENSVRFEENEGHIFVTGTLDTRNFGTINCYSEFAGEVNKDKIVEYINTLSRAKVIDETTF